jgi:hydantoinase/carbamoylase family amidase
MTDLHGQIEALAQIDSVHEGGGLTREVYTPEYSRAAELINQWMRGAGLEVREDAVGNLFGLWPGREPQLPRVLTGSHFDTTLNAGRYDGVVGVLGAIDAVRQLRARGFVPQRGIEVIGFAGEEPRFGAGCVGSRAMVGALTRSDLDRMTDRREITIAAAMRASGLDPDRIAEAEIDPAEYDMLVELHIEQGAVLEHRGIPIGVVEQIAAPHDLRITITGVPRHSGSTPMDLRRDALTGASELVLEIERLARESPSGSTVGTVGVLDVIPGAVNVIPGEVRMDVDIRDSDLAAREQVIESTLAKLRELTERRSLSFEVSTITEDTPARCDPRIVTAVREACTAQGIAHLGITSGAYHDAMVLGSKLPIGMIFVPSRDGISHHPDEYTAPEELELGVAVLAGTLERLTR